jgi:hypothetical protein
MDRKSDDACDNSAKQEEGLPHYKGIPFEKRKEEALRILKMKTEPMSSGQ